MKRIFLIFLCLTILGTLCACRVRLIADPALADTILQEQQPEETQPPTQEETAPPEQEPDSSPEYPPPGTRWSARSPRRKPRSAARCG